MKINLYIRNFEAHLGTKIQMFLICNFLIISRRLIAKATFSNDGTYIPALLNASP